MQFRNLTVLTAAASLAAAGAAHAATVTFDDLPVSGNGIHTTATSDGFDFNGAHFHIIDSPDSRLVENGTQYLAAEAAGGLGQPVTMTASSGGLFSLNGLDIAELWLPGQGPFDFKNVTLTGNVFGGGVLSAIFALDGIGDGAGGVNDFQTVTLSGWNNLTSVVISGMDANGNFGDYAVDNLIVNATPGVPEPAVWAMMLVGFGLVGATLRRRPTAALA